MNAPNSAGWRPEMGEAHIAGDETFTGNRALMLEERLIFEIGDTSTTGVDIDPAPAAASRLGGLTRSESIGLPGLSEPETVRHYTRLSRQNYGIDLGFFPLGSCTMKHNPRLNEAVARMKGFKDVHPLQPRETVQGALAVIHELADWLVTLTGMDSVAMSPKAGAHGELCGMMAIKAAIEAGHFGGFGEGVQPSAGQLSEAAQDLYAAHRDFVRAEIKRFGDKAVEDVTNKAKQADLLPGDEG